MDYYHTKFITTHCYFCGDDKPLEGPISTFYTKEQRQGPDDKGRGLYWFYQCKIPNNARICSICFDFGTTVCNGKRTIFNYRTINTEKINKSKLPNLKFIENWKVSLKSFLLFINLSSYFIKLNMKNNNNYESVAKNIDNDAS